MTIYDAIVVGAGQAGLAAGYYLQCAGLSFLILERGPQAGGSWPQYYDSLHLNTPARYSALPGLSFPAEPDSYPARDDVTAYLRAYASHFELPIQTDSAVERVDRHGPLFEIVTSAGTYLSRSLVAASGFFDKPFTPTVGGSSLYGGNMLHAAEYRNPEPFRGQRIVVVGGGNAAVQIGVELAEVAEVSLATREPIRLLPQSLLGRDIHFWLRATTLDRRQWLGARSAPVFVSDRYRAALTKGRPDRRQMFASFTPEGVLWADGRRERIDTVLFATGYRPAVGFLDRLSALDEHERVLHHDGVSASVPGLFYVGLPRQRSAASATLRGVGVDARLVVGQLRGYLSATMHIAMSEGAQRWDARGIVGASRT